jgi:phosphoglycerate dehydrogenase-like enzyme
VGILGYGGVGKAIGARIEALGGRVLPHRRGDGVGLLEEILSTADAVVLTLPETEETRGLLGVERLALLKPGAVFINVARGAVVDEGALIRLLEAGRIRGAGLDVFAQEPLPPDSPLWGLPNVLLTPHVSAVTRSYWERELNLIVENLARLSRGEPLINQVSAERGY